MEEKKGLIKNKKQMYVVIGAFALVLMLGTITYAFFNYTRTGTANTIRVGRIAFATNQSDTINLTNVFPITRTLAATDENNSDDVVITISGDTDYTGGVEYLITATGVTNTVGGKTIPISIIVTPSEGLGTVDSSYYTNRSSASSHIYKVEARNTLENNGRILVGYIAPNTTQGTASGINGTLTIRAFLDSSLIAISDTYYENAPTPIPTAPNDEYGTPASFGEGRVVLTTTEWNSLQSSGVSFKVKVEANEGIWVKQIPTISLSPASGSVASGSSTTSTISTTGDGAMTCSSSNQSIATCSVSGSTLTINGVAVGNATITVNQAEGTNYMATSTTYLVTVYPLAATYISSLTGLETNEAGNKIFTGADPDNYVWFNNEQWRIIGVYGDNLKIIKATPSTTSQKWQNLNSDGNTWSGSLMQSTYLYNTYWPTLSSTAQNMIEQNATWNVGACGYEVAAQAAYTCASSATWTGKIGLIASYEYLYAAENDGTCWTTSGSNYSGGCNQKDWLFSTVTNSGSSRAWTLSPRSDYSNNALAVSYSGFVLSNNVNYDSLASPVVFLKSTITITGGNGKLGETNSYKLG